MATRKIVLEPPIAAMPGHCSLWSIVLLLLASLNSSLANAQTEAQWRRQRQRMVDVAVRAAGVTDARVLESMAETPRHEFVPRTFRDRSYLDAGVPIGNKQTISSPFIVAYMTQTLEPKPTDRVLEIGTGSGYQAAILSPLVKEVYSIEIVESLGKRAAKVLKRLEYDNVFTKIGDGYQGWAEHAPFDKIIVTCSPEDIPKPLVEQLREGGLIVVPMGERHQQTLYSVQKVNGLMQPQALRPTLFVPMTGQAEDEREVLPDPTNPQLLNSDFEDGLDAKGFVKGWYYQRQMKWNQADRLVPQSDDVSDTLVEGQPVAPAVIDQPGGERVATANHLVEFSNQIPGQHSHLMQRVSIDGRKVSRIMFSSDCDCGNVRAGLYPGDLPEAALTFYDKRLHEVGRVVRLGPISGTMEPKSLRQEVRVPVAARTAIVRIGLFGATGTARFDNVQITKSKP